VPSDFDRLLADVRATFPRPDSAATKAARRRVLSWDGRLRRPALTRRLGTLAAAAVGIAATCGFTAGHWLFPAQGSAATELSIAATADTVNFGRTVTLYGTVASARANEPVLIEARECGTQGSFHLVGGATTVAGGAFAGGPGTPVRVTSEYRARWNGGTSAPVTVRVRPRIDARYRRGILSVAVLAGLPLDDARAYVEMFDAHGAPVTLRMFHVHSSKGTPLSSARIHLSVPHGRILQVVLPSAGRCFAQATSTLMWT
jgi:hypothetical protein